METLCPDVFQVYYSRLHESLIFIVILSFIVERVLSIIFENRLFIDRVKLKKLFLRKRITSDRYIGEITCMMYSILSIIYSRITINSK